MLTHLSPEVKQNVSTSTPVLGIQNIGQISITAKDVERATAFYRDVLGLPLLFTVPSMAFFDCGGVRFDAGHRLLAGIRPSQLDPLFPMAALQAGYQRLVQQGVDIVAPPRLIAPMPKHDFVDPRSRTAKATSTS